MLMPIVIAHIVKVTCSGHWLMVKNVNTLELDSESRSKSLQRNEGLSVNICKLRSIYKSYHTPLRIS